MAAKGPSEEPAHGSGDVNDDELAGAAAPLLPKGSAPPQSGRRGQGESDGLSHAAKGRDGNGEAGRRRASSPLHADVSKALMGLRGVCSLLIVAGHFFTNFSPPAVGAYPAFPLEYFGPVTVFFLLSGSALVTYGRGVEEDAEAPTWRWRRSFWARRIARIGPMYYVALAASLPGFVFYGDFASARVLGGIACSALMVQGFTLVGNDWSPPLWQVSAFALCYLVFPWVVRPVARWSLGARSLPTLLAACWLLPTGAAALFVVMEWPAGVLHTWVVTRFPQFLLGIALGVAAKGAARSGGAEPRFMPPGAWVAGHAADALSVVLAGYQAACSILGTVYGPRAWWEFMVLGEFAATGVWWYWLLALMRSDGHCWTVRVLSSRALAYLGEISLSVYCLQWPVLQLYTWLAVGRLVHASKRDRDFHMGTDTFVEGPFALDPYQLLPVLCILVTIASLATTYLEAPARRAVVRALSPAAASSSAVGSSRA